MPSPWIYDKLTLLVRHHKSPCPPKPRSENAVSPGNPRAARRGRRPRSSSTKAPSGRFERSRYPAQPVAAASRGHQARKRFPSVSNADEAFFKSEAKRTLNDTNTVLNDTRSSDTKAAPVRTEPHKLRHKLSTLYREGPGLGRPGLTTQTCTTSLPLFEERAPG